MPASGGMATIGRGKMAKYCLLRCLRVLTTVVPRILPADFHTMLCICTYPEWPAGVPGQASRRQGAASPRAWPVSKHFDWHIARRCDYGSAKLTSSECLHPTASFRWPACGSRSFPSAVEAAAGC